jgi:uncharacterized protein
MHKINPPPFSLALITGASSGIGTALCKLLAKQGIPLLLSGRDLSKLEQLAQQLNSQVPVSVHAADLAIPQERRSLIAKVQECAPDLVINNAGFGFYGEALGYETSKHLELLEVDGSSVIELTLEAARTLLSKGQKGVILNVSSAASMVIFPLFASYAASKALVTHFSKSFDCEMSPFGIRILTACPGVVATAFRQRALQESGLKAERQAPTTRQRPSMSADYAAEMIWKQILRRQRVSIFDWKTRLALFFARLLPEELVARFLTREMKKISPSLSLKL